MTWEIPDQLDLMVNRAHLVSLEVRDLRVSLDPMGRLVHLVILVPLDQMVSQDRQEPLVRVEHLVKLVKQVPPDHKDNQEVLALKASLDLKEPRVALVLRVHQEQRVRLDHRDPLGRLVRSDLPGLLVNRVHQALPVLKERQDNQVQPALRVNLAPRENVDHQGTPEPRVARALLGH